MSTLLNEIHEVAGGENYGTYLSICCPYHGDSHPSMMVYEDWFRCAACGVNGPTPRLLTKIKSGGVNFSYGHEDDLHISNPFRSWLKTESLSSLLYRSWMNANLNPGQTTYLSKQRGFSDRIRRKLGIGVLGNFFTFPVTNQNKEVAGAFVRSDNTLPSRYFVPKDQDPNLVYVPSWKLLVESSVVFLTFGPLDAISLMTLGFASMSTLSGKTLNVTALDDIRKRIVFIPDYGEDREAYKLASKLGWRGEVCLFPYPDGTKDINEVYRSAPDLIAAKLSEYTKDGNQLARCKRNCDRSDPEPRTIRECGETGHYVPGL